MDNALAQADAEADLSDEASHELAFNLGCVALAKGDYPAAERWIKLARGTLLETGIWLKATSDRKLEPKCADVVLRNGDHPAAERCIKFWPAVSYEKNGILHKY
jgi:hypothetical protein